MTDSVGYQAMLNSPRCGAKTRAGTPCRAPAVVGKTRCRMHGGAAGSGAPKGNQNALKHGACTRAFREQTKAMNAEWREIKRILAEQKRAWRQAKRRQLVSRLSDYDG